MSGSWFCSGLTNIVNSVCIIPQSAGHRAGIEGVNLDRRFVYNHIFVNGTGMCT